MGSDPNWLLSSTAQCTAALVAIVGGFLVSRLVAVATERQGLLRHFDDLRRRARRVTSELTSVEVVVERSAEERFFWQALDDHVRGRGQLSVNVSASRHTPAGTTSGDARVWAAAINDEVRAAFDQLDSGGNSADTRAGSPRTAGPFGPDRRGEILRRVSAFKARGASANRGAESIAAATLEEVRDRHESYLNKQTLLRGEAAGLAEEMKLTGDQLARIATVPYAWPGVAVLVGFALVGAIVPLVMLSRRPVPDSATSRNLVVGLFTTGLTALVIYLAALVRELSKTEPNPSYVGGDSDDPDTPAG